MSGGLATPSAVPHGSVPPYPVERLYRFTTHQYLRMIETGVLVADERVELLEGWLVKRQPRSPPHDSAVSRVSRRLARLLSVEWVLRVRSALSLTDRELEPDFAIVRGPEDRYSRRHPVARDVAAIIEVADSSLFEDRQRKGVLYARARLPLYWLVNITESRVEVYTNPKAGRTPAYRQRRD